MFKEAFVGIIILFLFYLLCRRLYHKKQRVLSSLVMICLVIACLANIIYNAVVMFPDFYMDIINGRFRYGTFSGNLFAYSDEFMFQDNILFPVLRNRTVTLDDTAGFYEKFFTLYADECLTGQITDQQREAILSHKADFDFSHEFSCIGIMDYVKDEIPDSLTASFENEIYPDVFIHTGSLKGQQRLVVIMDADYNLYVMSEAYYEEITGGTPNV